MNASRAASALSNACSSGAFCGYHHLETFLPGHFEVRLSPDADPGKVESFLAKLGKTPGPLQATEVLARRVDKTSGELLKESLRRHGLYASVEKPSLFSRLGAVSLTLVYVTVLLPVLTLIVPWLGNPAELIAPHRTVGSVLTDLFVLGLALILVVRGAFYLISRDHKPPLLSSVDDALLDEYGWMNDLVPHLAATETQEMRRANAGLVEKYVRVRELDEHLPPALSRRIEAVLLKAVELASLVSNVDAHFERLHRAPGNKLSELTDQTATLLDRRATLERHLAQTTALLNRLVAKAVSRERDRTTETVEGLDDATRALEQQIQISREIQRELEALA